VAAIKATNVVVELPGKADDGVRAHPA